MTEHRRVGWTWLVAVVALAVAFGVRAWTDARAAGSLPPPPELMGRPPALTLGWFVKYAEMVPGDYLALAHIGSCLSALGRYAEAEREYRRAVAIDPAQADARGNLATLLVRLGRHAEAVRELRRLVADETSPRSPTSASR